MHEFIKVKSPLSDVIASLLLAFLIFHVITLTVLLYFRRIFRFLSTISSSCDLFLVIHNLFFEVVFSFAQFTHLYEHSNFGIAPIYE